MKACMLSTSIRPGPQLPWPSTFSSTTFGSCLNPRLQIRKLIWTTMGKTTTAVTMKDTMLWDPTICTLLGASLDHAIASESLRSSEEEKHVEAAIASVMEKEKQRKCVNQICSVHCFVVFNAIHTLRSSGPKASLVLYRTPPANSFLNPAVFYFALTGSSSFRAF